MKKITLIIIVSFVVIGVILSGCFQTKKKSKSEKLIGTWISEDSFYRQYTFKKDGICLINNYNLEGTYYINSGGQLVINQSKPYKSDVFDYSFNYNNDKLTLTDIETGVPEVFKKK